MELKFEHDVQLQAFNTFGVPARASVYISIGSEAELAALYNSGAMSGKRFLVLGGGSNTLFTQDFDGLVVHINIPGITHAVSGDEVIVKAGAGVVWNDLVWHCIDHGFAGVENMALIPGSVGASPIQNIGAYGTELMDVFHECRVFSTQTGEFSTFDREACAFSYRDSIFKKPEMRGKYIVTEVLLALSLVPRINASYGAIQAELDARGIKTPSIRDMAEVVSAIRVSKLPDPATIGNSGSFFKNPIINVHDFAQLKETYPDIVSYPIDEENIKLAAGWLIEHRGWKGKQVGGTGTWKNQALVLVNYENALGSEVYELSENIIGDVKEHFGVELEREVNII